MMEASLRSVSPTLKAVLVATGFDKAPVLARGFSDVDFCDGTVMEFIREHAMGSKQEELEDMQAEMAELQITAKKVVKMASVVTANATDFEIGAEMEKRRREKGLAEHELKFSKRAKQEAHSRAPEQPPLGRYRDETGGKRSQRWDGDPEACAKKEQGKRAKAVDEMVMLMKEMCGGVDAQLRLAAGGRRAATLRKRVNAWKGFRKWLIHSKGRPTSTCVEDWLDYLEDKASEPCGMTVLSTIVGLMSFIDDVLGRQGAVRYSNDTRVHRAFKEYRWRLAEQKAGRPRGQAQRPHLLDTQSHGEVHLC